jgi:starch phosphorylase
VGRVPLYLLDTNVVSNAPEDRGITAQLYGGDSRNRIRQEIVLGIGGIRALKELGHNPAVFHLNEGHAAFASLERARFYVSEKNLSFEEAREIVTSSTAFTTHTPVPAGIDTFDQNLMANYFGNFVSEMGISFNKLMDFGRKNIYDQQEPFNMAILAMNFSAFINGVSKLHSTVTRKMWSALWPHLPERDTPIIGITNGIHIPSWISMDMAGLFDRYLGPGWIEEPVGQRAWDRIETIPDEELWRTHERRRERLVAFTRERVRRQLRRRVMPHSEVESATAVLDPEALTIVFCRRFATYKRASLILSDEARLARLLNDPKHPVQLIFAGKAHPHDDAGKDLIKKIVNLAAKEEFRHRVVFIEDYDMNVARYLVQGADVWLNNPRRPLEASGTSGMKATANGALNLSILDGWWCEGYNSMNGWAIGAGEEYLDTAYQDKVESRSLYEILESEIIPLFYERGPDNIPRKWVRRMKNAMKSICPVFNSHRMLAEYNSRFYVPAAENTHRLTARSFAGVRELVEWKMRIYSNWDNLHVEDVQLDMNDEIPVGTDLKVKASINLAELRPEDITVDLYYGPLDAWGSLQYSTITPMHPSSGRNGHYSYTGTIPCEATGRFGFRVRILPRHKLMASPYSLHVIHWS